MKKYFTFSLWAIAPLLLHADGDSLEAFKPKNSDAATLAKAAPSDSMNFEEFAYGQNNGQNNYKQNNSGSSSKGKEDQKNFNLPVDHAGAIVFAEFLWWKLNETGLDYAVHKKPAGPFTPGGSLNNTLFYGTTHRVDIEWNPGFRVGLGYRSQKELWELSGIYTYFYTKGDDSVSCGDCVRNNAALPDIIATTVADELNAPVFAKANLHFWYHVGDVELAKPISLGKHTSCRFVVAPTMAFIQQHFHTLGMDNTGLTTPCLAQLAKTRMDWKFSGGGIKLGIDSHWNVFNGFNFLFGAYFSALYGVYVNKWIANQFYDTLPCTSSSTLQETPYGNTTIKDRRNVFSTRILGGIGYNYPFKWCNFEIYANFELNTWFNLTDQYRLEGNNPNFDKIRVLQTPTLNLAGLDFGLKLNF